MNLRTHVSDAVARIEAAFTLIERGIGGEAAIEYTQDIRTAANDIAVLLDKHSLLAGKEKDKLYDAFRLIEYWWTALNSDGLLNEINEDASFEFSLDDAIQFLRYAQKEVTKDTLSRAVLTLADYACSETNTKLADLYDDDDHETLRDALNFAFRAALKEDFEYPDHSHKTMMRLFKDAYYELVSADRSDAPNLITRANGVARLFVSSKISGVETDALNLALSVYSKNEAMTGEEWVEAISKAYDIHQSPYSEIIDTIRVAMGVHPDSEKHFSLKPSHYDVNAFTHRMGWVEIKGVRESALSDLNDEILDGVNRSRSHDGLAPLDDVSELDVIEIKPVYKTLVSEPEATGEMSL